MWKNSGKLLDSTAFLSSRRFRARRTMLLRSNIDLTQAAQDITMIETEAGEEVVINLAGEDKDPILVTLNFSAMSLTSLIGIEAISHSTKSFKEINSQIF